jgi:tetratricopeptide (TPR) repeat protein
MHLMPLAARDRSRNGWKPRWFWLLAMLLSLVACGKKTSPPAEQNLSAELIDAFYVGVASLDVEENERASTIFADLSTKIPEEPAVWANLGIVRLRLGNVEAAQEALARAEKLAPGNKQITIAQAIVDERQGQFARAIERLRKIPNPDAAVLYQILELFGRTGQADGPREQLALYDRILQSEPNNLVALFGKARLLTRGENQAELSETINRFDVFRTNWTEEAVQQLDAANAAVSSGNLRTAATHLTFLQNLSIATPEYKDALAKLGAPTGSVGQPMHEFVKYPQPAVLVAAADLGLQFEITQDTNLTAPPVIFAVASTGTNTSASVVSMRDGALIWNGISQAFTNLTPSTNASFCAVDLNGDFTEDFVLLTENGLAIFLQDNQGQLTKFIPNEELRAVFNQGGHGVWAFDFEADGDLDLLVSQAGINPRVLRNNGDIGTTNAGGAAAGFTAIDLAGFPELRDVCWADFDADGDSDLALLDANGRLLVSWNDRAGSFTQPAAISQSAARAFAFGDLTGDGRMTVVAFETNGSIKRHAYESNQQKWSAHEFATTATSTSTHPPTTIHLADLDNNGAADIIASSGTTTEIWLNEGADKFQKLERAPALLVTSIADVNDDGFLDLLGLTSNGAATARTRGAKSYHWQSIHTRALASQADGRINSFGIGGKIEVRAGQLLAVMPITSSRTHFGLGNNLRAGIARIVWPNGTAQVEFELRADQDVTAMQRLKGSCPWVFTRVGDQFHFVKDFIWRSPLGMRINSQDTAGVDQTEDWIFIPGDLLTPHHDSYEIRITAELWETHFFDHVSLMVVDHPASFEVFIDERFVPTQQPKLAVIATEPPRPFASARDEGGRDVLNTLAKTDGDYLDDFPLGRFQGIGADHWIEFELPTASPTGKPLVLIGEGWIYPTDSSLNVAISQGEHSPPRGLVLEVQNADGGWDVARDHLGFPAGKNKTVVIPFPAELISAGRRHFRLRTNLEIYWDRLAWSIALPDAELKTTKVETLSSELRHRGFSKLNRPERRRPDLPIYDELIGIGPRWRDLEGFYTRHGDVRELLETIDDRYVIMNAGDEFILKFAVPPAPAPGWKRDLVLVGDGWVKDGDYNTANSPTVHPLPSHASKEYGRAPSPITDDPIFQQHVRDWELFHTRYVTPLAFERGLLNGQHTKTTTQQPNDIRH